MTKGLEVIEGQQEFKEQVSNMATYVERQMTVDETLRLCDLGGGVIQFAETIFPAADITSIHAQLYDREPKGRGAHFDLYHDLLDDRYPYIGVFNLRGKAKVTAAHLPDDLAKAYFERFPEPNESSAQARRHFSSIALDDPSANIYEGRIEAETGMVITQRKDQPHVIHNIVPTDPDNPGKFIKLAYLNDSPKTLQAAGMAGMKSIDKLLTGILSSSSTQIPQDLSDFISEVPPGALPSDRLDDRLISRQATAHRRPGLSSGDRRD